MPLFDADDKGGGGSDDAEAKAKADADAKAKADPEAKSQKSFDAWLADQPDDIKAMYSSHVGDLKSALQKEREANRGNSKALKRLEELEAKEQERLDAQKSELEKAKEAQLKAEEEREAARSELETERRKNAVIAAATKMGFKDPDDAYTLANLSEIERSDDGKWSGIDESLKALAESKPYLISKNGKGDGLGNDTRLKGQKEKPESKANQKRPLVRL